MIERGYKLGWQDGFQECLNLGEEKRLLKARKQGAVNLLKKIENEKLIARQCMDYQGLVCKNKSCLNTICTLNNKKIKLEKDVEK